MRCKWIIFVLFMVPLAGCAPTESQREAQIIVTRGQAALERSKICKSPLENNPRYSRIYTPLTPEPENPLG